MRSHYGGGAVAVAILAVGLLLLSGCHRSPEKSPLVYIMLTYNGGVCEQNGSSGIVDVSPNQAVVYQGAAPLSEFQVRFATCPFASCPVDSPYGTSENVGRPNPGTAGGTFQYSGLTMNNQPCQNAGVMGVRITSGP
ncbi:MAG TPA: hypothetical protein VKV05_11370 [Terriglobales bacterium]|nr:hypothetical protein [Terriglobales bacterium]